MTAVELKEKRINSGLKINKICEYMDIERSTYRLMENGKREIKAIESIMLNLILSRNIETELKRIRELMGDGEIQSELNNREQGCS